MKIDLMETTVILRSLLGCWLLLVCTQCKNKEAETRDRQQKTIQALVRDEEAVLEVTMLAGQIADSIKNKVVVSAETRSLFAEKIVLTDLLVSNRTSVVLDAAHGIASSQWAPGESQTITFDEAEQAGIFIVRAIGMFMPGPGRNTENVVFAPVKAVPVDDGMAGALCDLV